MFILQQYGMRADVEKVAVLLTLTGPQAKKVMREFTRVIKCQREVRFQSATLRHRLIKSKATQARLRRIL